jgi:acetyl-CoA carboxylase/biotin carboxylase 1
VESADGWASGLFDRGSFQEYLGGWAKTIITGRARLGGIPVGVIIPECRSTTTRIPADPAQPDSTERVQVQAGNVWYPDSSYKTASTIRDVNREGLPLVFLINIRGFSGGQRDMYDSVLKFGSMIVDALVEFKQPVLVYIPQRSELRGGAWVVVDPTINENVMEMWCDETARGGVLEAAGAASIKFRQHDQLQAAHRLDPVLRQLDEQLALGEDVADKIKQREKLVLPVYSQLATEFADAHDRPGRMVAKGVVHGVVPWRQARSFFTSRLRRLLKEFEVAKRIPSQDLKDARATLREIYEESGEAVANVRLLTYSCWFLFAFSPFAFVGVNQPKFIYILSPCNFDCTCEPRLFTRKKWKYPRGFP